MYSTKKRIRLEGRKVNDSSNCCDSSGEGGSASQVDEFITVKGIPSSLQKTLQQLSCLSL